MKENKIYKTIFKELSKEKYQSVDAKELAKILTKRVSKKLISKQKKQVFDVLTNDWERCGVISKRCGIKSNIVSVILTQILQETTLVEAKIDGRFYLYRIAE